MFSSSLSSITQRVQSKNGKPRSCTMLRKFFAACAWKPVFLLHQERAVNKTKSASRRQFLVAGLRTGAGAAVYPALAAARQSETCAAATEVSAFELDEITIGQLSDGMAS